MFEDVVGDLEGAIEGLDIPVDGDALGRCVGLLDRLTAKVTVAVGDFDRAEGWREVGAVSMTAWLRSRAGRSAREANVLAKTGRRIVDLPVTRDAYLDGTLSSGQVQAIVANLSEDTAPLFADQEGVLVPVLAPMPAADVATAMQQWAQAARDALQADPGDPDNTPDPDHNDSGPDRRLHVSRTETGRREVTGSLDPEAGALLETALRIARTQPAEGEPARSPAQRRADELVDVLRWFLENQGHDTGRRERPHLNVFLDHQDLAADHMPSGDPQDQATRRPPSGWLADGTVLDPATVTRLACDCWIHRVVHQGRSAILDYGRGQRTASTSQWNALVARDQHCRYPGCDRPAQWCEAHHVPAWEHGGTTSIETMVLECSRHHHLVHTPGWTNKLHPDGTYQITNPHGDTYTSHPPGQPPNLFHHPPP